MSQPIQRRHVHGMILLNKPLGVSSNRILRQVQWLYKAKKAGHAGCLDPLATGLLPLCLGEATKFALHGLLESNKTYEVTGRLGLMTSTGDAEGEVLQDKPVTVTQQALVRALQPFQGKITQSPPKFSALKYQGKPLYYYALKGIEVPQKTRQVTIHACELISVTERDFSLRVTCSKGTYIRSLVEDIGQALGCGASVIQLHRSHVGPYGPESMVNLSEIEAAVEQGNEAALLRPIDDTLQAMPKLQLTEQQHTLIYQGQPIALEDDQTSALQVRFYFQDNFCGLGELTEVGLFHPKRLVAMGGLFEVT